MIDEWERARDLEALHERLRDCRLCLEAGYDMYPRAIFSGGISARILLVGQAPGITEKEAGRPFNAGSGKRLFQWRAGAGIDETWFRATQYMYRVTQSTLRSYPDPAFSANRYSPY